MKAGMVWNRVTISPGFLVFFCAYYYFDPAGTFWPFFLGASAHELGHLTALKLLRVPVHSLRFGASGACLETANMSYRKEFLSAAAGPAANLLLALGFLHREPVFALVNLALLLYNLLPFYPLDGGRILRCMLQFLLGSGRAAMLTERIASGCCLLLLWGLSIYLTCILHEGLWPVLLCALITVRIAGTIFPERGNFTNKRIDKSKIAC
ncbi:MAG: hypothetical protein IJA48_08425 [Oscillospiraceae bacterium]|nr:hypothetical protein [Oscillospiraceae bacterium]